MKVKFIILFFVLLINELSLSVLASDEVTTDIVLSTASMNLKLINSVQFSSTEDLTLTDEGTRLLNAPKEHFTNALKFFEQNGKYRSEVSFEDWENGDVRRKRISLFAGDKYQLFDPEISLLTRSSQPRFRNTSIDLNPLLIPYGFAFTSESTITVSSLRDPQTWDKLRKDAKFQGFDETEGYKCAVISFEIANYGKKLVRTVYFATDYSYFPIKIEEKAMDGTMVGRITILKFKEHTDERGNIIIPTQSLIEGYDRNGNHFQTVNIKINTDSLKINEQIPDDIFEIPIAQVEHLIDTDLGITVHPHGANPTYERSLLEDPTQTVSPSPPVEHELDKKDDISAKNKISENSYNANAKEESAPLPLFRETAKQENPKKLMYVSWYFGAILAIVPVFILLFLRRKRTAILRRNDMNG